jgi:hypothetical protein
MSIKYSKRLENLYNSLHGRYGKDDESGIIYMDSRDEWDPLLDVFSNAADVICRDISCSRSGSENEFFTLGFKLAKSLKRGENIYCFCPRDSGLCLYYKAKLLREVMDRVKENLKDGG